MRPVNLADFESIAQERLPRGVYDFIAGGAEDEVTLRDNCAAFRRYHILPRVLVDVCHINPSTTVLGESVSLPVLLAPTAFQTIAHADGELASARAARSAGTITVVSTFSSLPLEEIATAEAPRWFQLYCYRDRGVTKEFVQRAEAAGYSAICLTVDVARVGRRERDLRNSFQLPHGVRAQNFGRLTNAAAIKAYQSEGGAFSQYISDLVDPSLTWEVVDWLQSVTRLPVLVKGVLAAPDARLAVEHGVRGVVVSNHGARQLDSVPATIDALPEIVTAVDGRAGILLDGGIRRGTDVFKALAMGADAVLIGRPYVWGLAAGGEAGVVQVLELLKQELEATMALAGCPTVADIKPAHVRPAAR
jgi:isopentenyl diphosphate isomerase/L-lactate dehydrogenase-like FMN-dependent dehydrogenase